MMMEDGGWRRTLNEEAEAKQNQDEVKKIEEITKYDEKSLSFSSSRVFILATESKHNIIIPSLMLCPGHFTIHDH